MGCSFATGIWHRIRATAWALAMACALLAAPDAQAQSQEPPVKGEVKVTTSGGFTRVVFTLADEVESTTRVAGGIVVIAFKKPVTMNIDRLAVESAGMVGAARADPDGLGIRLALAKKVTVNSMAAAERLFVDILPDNWAGLPPGLPADVIDELSRRARDAQKTERQRRALARQKAQTAIRVRVSVQPTFVRYVFDLPELTPVSSDRGKEALVLNFAAGLKFDLGDVQGNLPEPIEKVESDGSGDLATVKFVLRGAPDIRTFREDNSYVVDVSLPDSDGKRATPGEQIDKAAREAQAKAQPPATMPARVENNERKADAAPPPSAKPAAPATVTPVPPAPARASVAQPPVSEAPAPIPPTAPAPQAAAVANPNAERETPEPNPAPAAPALAAAPQSEARQPEEAAAPARDDFKIDVSGHDDLRVVFAFAEPTAAAVFRRADTLWVVLDTKTTPDLGALTRATGDIVSAAWQQTDDARILRIKLRRPRLTNFSAQGNRWILTIADNVSEPTRPLSLSRTIPGAARASVTIPFEGAARVHRLTDPDIGDSLIAITAPGPARGFLKNQDFLEFRALASTHGIVLSPIADDLSVETMPERVVIGRPGGLTLSSADPGRAAAAASALPVLFDPQSWGMARQANFVERQAELMRAAASAPEARRAVQRIELARFYLAREMYVEAKGVLDVMLSDERARSEDVAPIVMHALTCIMLGRTEQGLKALANPVVGNQHDAPLWRALALARQGKWPEARVAFRDTQGAIATQPLELQRMALSQALRAAIEVGDFGEAVSLVNEIDSIGVPDDLQPQFAVLGGKLAQGLGRAGDALSSYRVAADSRQRPAAAQGRLRELALRFETGDLPRAEFISELETLSTVWRGDETEIEALAMLARLYTADARYRDAFQIMRAALSAHPNSEMTRKIQDEAMASFDSLFLAGKGDALPAIEALSLFYDFRELTPIGRRGDELIRRLADRLVSVDLLKQAAELLQHQVDHRLQGAARAQVAARLAVIYLMDHKPERAQAVLRSTRQGELNGDLRQLRLMLEARALSDIGRHDVALEVVGNLDRREATRLRADILWNARRYAPSSEQTEKLLGERWRDFIPLNPQERTDVLRAAIGYALGEDTLGLNRLKEKFGPKMADEEGRRAFEIATAPYGKASTEFLTVSRAVAATDTMEAFLRELRTGFPDAGALSPVAAADRMKPAVAAKAGAADLPTAGVRRAVR